MAKNILRNVRNRLFRSLLSFSCVVNLLQILFLLACCYLIAHIVGMGLASLFGIWMAQKLNLFHQCLVALTTQSSLGQV